MPGGWGLFGRGRELLAASAAALVSGGNVPITATAVLERSPATDAEVPLFVDRPAAARTSQIDLLRHRISFLERKVSLLYNINNICQYAFNTRI